MDFKNTYSENNRNNNASIKFSRYASLYRATKNLRQKIYSDPIKEVNKANQEADQAQIDSNELAMKLLIDPTGTNWETKKTYLDALMEYSIIIDEITKQLKKSGQPLTREMSSRLAAAKQKYINASIRTQDPPSKKATSVAPQKASQTAISKPKRIKKRHSKR